MKFNNNLVVVVAIVLFILTCISISYMLLGGVSNIENESHQNIQLNEPENNYNVAVSDIFNNFSEVTYKRLYQYEINNEKDLNKYLKELENSTFVINDVSDIENKSIYNYKIKEFEFDDNNLVIIFYGLLKEYMETGLTLTNNEDININLSEIEGVSDIEYLENLFSNNMDKFMLFKYSFSLEKDSYKIEDFEIVDKSQ